MKKLFALTAMALLATVASFAGDFDFTVVNDTGYTIDKLFCAPADSTDWGDDVLGVDQLLDGNKVEVKFNDLYSAFLKGLNVTKFDLKAEYTDGSSHEFYGLSLLEINTLWLSLDKKENGVATYE